MLSGFLVTSLPQSVGGIPPLDRSTHLKTLDMVLWNTFLRFRD